MNGLPVTRTVKTTRGMDSLAGARRVLRDHAALTFEQLSWPTDAQLAGDDGGVYRASAQLFVNELQALKKRPGAFARDARNPAKILQLADGVPGRVP